jgi:hypothetical protein
MFTCITGVFITCALFSFLSFIFHKVWEFRKLISGIETCRNV